MAKTTPIRSALRTDSRLVDLVQVGLGAVAGHHRDRIEEGIRTEFTDSLNIDQAFERSHAANHRWDYLLGIGKKGRIIAIEPHPAKDSQIDELIRKKQEAMAQLASHWKSSDPVKRWIWIATGSSKYTANDKNRRRLEKAGILFVGSTLRSKHLS